MGTMIRAGNDVVTFLKGQHEQVKDLFEAVIAARGKARVSAFMTLRRMMAVHETAEEEVVHPAAKRALPDGAQIVAMRLREEHDAKAELAKLERLEIDSHEFDAGIKKLKAAVLAHAEAEEKQEFERIGAIFDEAKLTRMRKAAEMAEAFAPTHPHAGVESKTANMLVGPFASMMDCVRDAMTPKS